MLDLPGVTEVHKMLPKKLVYEHFALTAKERERFDEDISKLHIVHELSPATIPIKDGAVIHAIFVLQIDLKTREYNDKNLELIAGLIPQNIVFALKSGTDIQLAVYKTRILATSWMSESDARLPLDGLSMDTLWQNIILHIGNFTLEQSNTLEEQLELNTARDKRQKEIERLERLARKEVQPRKKLELFDRIQELKKEEKKTE